MKTIFFLEKSGLWGRKNLVHVFEDKGEVNASLTYDYEGETNSAYGGFVDSGWMSRRELAIWLKARRSSLYI